MPGFQFCEPNCPRRKPGCQDHCGYHAERKRIYEERKKQVSTYKEANRYTHDTMAKNFDRRIKRQRSFGASKWRRRGG